MRRTSPRAGSKPQGVRFPRSRTTCRSGSGSASWRSPTIPSSSLRRRPTGGRCGTESQLWLPVSARRSAMRWPVPSSSFARRRGRFHPRPDTAAASGVVVLLSDGAQTRGLLQPEDGARLARQASVPVYTIALGTLGGTVTVPRGDAEVVVPVPPDRPTLARHRGIDGGLDVRGNRCRAAQLRLRQAGSRRRPHVEAPRGDRLVRRSRSGSARRWDRPRGALGPAASLTRR